MRDETLKRLAGADWLAAAQPFFACLDGAEGRTRAVGGIVRDTLLGRSRGTTDIDMATELAPEEVMARGEAAGLGVHPTGLAHGTITLVSAGQAVEVTTLRRDVETFGRHAKVAFGADWAEDARRRDFTMNALYCGPDGALFDPLDGLDDCLDGRVRFIGDADARIAEDRLRVYRYFRFVASHGGQRFDDEAIAACVRAAGSLDALSAERVGSEMIKLMSTARCASTLKAMSGVGILDVALFNPAVIDAMERLEALASGTDAVMRLGLLKAMGQPLGPLRRGWRLSNAVIEASARVAEGAGLAGSEDWAALGYRFPDDYASGIAVAAAINDRPRAWLVDGLERVAPYAGAVFPLGGDDLIARGLAPGPQLGGELKRLETLWLESRCTLDRAALLAVAATRPE